MTWNARTQSRTSPRPRDRRARTYGICFVLATLSVAACGKIAGLGDYGVGSPDAPAGILFSAAECRACVAGECAPALAACEADSDCAAEAGCLFGCEADDGKCRYECLIRGASTRAMRTLAACQAERCYTSCATCGAIFAGNGADCSHCAQEDTAPGGLCELADACMLEKDDCRAFIVCLAAECERLGQVDPKCRMACAGPRPEAAREFYQTVGARYFGGCRDRCNGGQQWQCETPTPWPPRSALTASVTLRLPDPAAGVQVRACRIGDPSCSDSFGDRTTDASGMATFEVDQLQAPIVYFEVHGGTGIVDFAAVSKRYSDGSGKLG